MQGQDETGELIDLFAAPAPGLPEAGPFACLLGSNDVTLIEGNEWVINAPSLDLAKSIVEAIGGRIEVIDCGDGDLDRSSTYVPPTETPDALTYEFSCTSDSSIGFAYIEGRVKNISGTRLENVTAVGSWYTDDRSFITSDDTLIDYTALLADQTSPFKVISRYNPAMAKCNVEFKELFGGLIPARQIGEP